MKNNSKETNRQSDCVIRPATLQPCNSATAVNDEISAEQRELATYFEQKLNAYSATQPSQRNAHFLGGLTTEEFFALNEPEQSRLWNAAHNKATEKLKNYEHPIREDAIPT